MAEKQNKYRAILILIYFLFPKTAPFNIKYKNINIPALKEIALILGM